MENWAPNYEHLYILNDDNALLRDISPILFPWKQTFQATDVVSAKGPIIIASALNIVKRQYPEYFA